MPQRSDKRDQIALSAYLSGLQVEFIDGVDPSLIAQKAIPQVRIVSLQGPGGLRLTAEELESR